MRKLFLPTLFICLFPLLVSAQTSAPTALRGVVVDENDSHALAGVKVTLANQNIATTTNASGEFVLIYLEPMDEEVIFEADGYVADITLVNLEAGQTNDIGTFALKQDIRKEVQDEIILNLSEADLNDDEGKSQAMASGMSASQDVFNNTSAFAWSSARFRRRGYEQQAELTYINGINFNAAERGTFNYSALGGLNDASRNKEVVNGIEANSFSFGSIGSATNILMDATRYAQGWKIGVAATNRNYKGRVTATYASGLLQNGWAFVGQLAYRYAPATKLNIIGSGSDYNSFGYFFSAEKRWGSNHRLSLVTFGAPTQRGQNAAVTQEVYNLYGSNYYNPYWGFQNGKVRNSREVHSFDPTVIASYEWKITDTQTFRAGIGYHYSLYSNSALTFFNAPDPRPDYYRNLPSFLWDGQFDNHGNWIEKSWSNSGAYDESFNHWDGTDLGGAWLSADNKWVGATVDANTYNSLVNLWRSRDPQATQINWDNIYAANYANDAANPGTSAKYMLERRHNDIVETSANVLYNNTAVKHLNITAGLELRESKGIHYKTVDDLLGAQQWIDIDPFADRDLKELATNIDLPQDQIDNVRQNDINNPNAVTHDGDKFGYDYTINIYGAKLWAQNQWSWNNVDFYYALQFNVSEFDRTTRMLNGRAWYLANLKNQAEAHKYLGVQYRDILAGTFADSYKGYQHIFVDPSFKLGACYRPDGHNQLRVNAMAETTPPLARDAYLSPRVHDRVVQNIYRHDNAHSLNDFYAASEKRVSADLTYEFNYPIVRGRITAYYTQFWNGTELNGYYDDEVRTFVNQAITGINRRHIGVEAAAAFKLGTYFTLTPIVSYGDYRYTSDAFAVTSAENGMAIEKNASGNVYEVTDKVLINGLRVANGPQLNSSLKLSFFHPKMWFADITLSYYDFNYLDYAPSRRMYGMFYGNRWTEDGSIGTKVNGSYFSMGAIRTDDEGNVVTDKYGTPLFAEDETRKDGLSIYHFYADQEKLTDRKVWNRFMIDASVGKLIYLPNRQSLSINLSVSNLTNNTHFKTGGYQQARLPRGTKGQDPNATSYITPNVYKFPAKYYYAWGINFFLSATYKF